MQIGLSLSPVGRGIARAYPSFTLVGSSPTSVNILSVGKGYITSVQGGNIKARVTPSRVSGVAPLYVNFDATATTKTGDANPEHNLFYAHNFGDSGAGLWANGVQSAGLTSKNAGYGPVSGHVYETPGTYVYNLVVMDGAETKIVSGTITVTDPDVVYAGAATICLSTSGNFIEAPVGSSQLTVTSDMYAELITTPRLASNKRILFCKADAWTCSAYLTSASITGMTLGGYGTGVAATFGSGTMVSVTPSVLNGPMFRFNAGNSDIRVCNFRITADRYTSAGGLNNSISQMLFYKVEIRGCEQGFNAFPGSGGTNNVFDQNCYYECLVDDVYGEPFVNTKRCTATYDDTTDTFTAVGHPFPINRTITFPVSPPTGFNNTTEYFISATGYTADTFRISSTLGGAAVALTTSGSCTVARAALHGGIGAFVGLVRGGFMGCYLDACNHGEQTLRIPFIDRGHINNNHIKRPNQAKNSLKIHSFAYNEVALYSEKFVVSGNVIDLRNGYAYGDVIDGETITAVGYNAITVGNGGSSNNERVHNGIVENNLSIACAGQPMVNEFMNVSCPNMTIRNNIFSVAIGDGVSPFTPNYNYSPTAASGHPASGANVHMLTINTGGTVEAPIGIRCYNNSLYCNIDAMGECAFVQQNGAGASDIQIVSNLWYHPFVVVQNTNRVTLSNLGGATGLTVTNNTNDTTLKDRTSPNFGALPPVALSDWKPGAGSYAIATSGTPVCLRDFNNASRYGGFNHMGAVLP